MTGLRATLALVPVLFGSPNGGRTEAASSPTSAVIDADVWTPVSASVAHDDIAAMGRVYHPSAVLVTADGTRPIAQALVGWGKDMKSNRSKGIRASVALRFANRQDDAMTAFESGIFQYTLTDRSGTSTPSYRRFEALLVKQGGKWRIVMEHQLDAATEAAWNELH
jgi:ketosteroid isomerase-like protein